MDATIATEKKYVIKKPFDGRRSRLELIVIEHIANSLYYLFGVPTPKLYITYDENKAPQLASEVLQDYQDYSDFMGGADFLESLSVISGDSDSETIDRRVAFFNQCLAEKKVSIKGREFLLVASILLQDFDVLGRGLDNVGVIPGASPGVYQIVKIDPGCANLSSNAFDFKSIIDITSPLISKDYSNKVFNLGKTIIGPLHYKEFFHQLDKSKVQLAIDIIRSIPEQEIKKHVCRQEYLQFVSEDYLKHIAKTIIERRNYLVSLYKADTCIFERTATVGTFFRPGHHFDKKTEKIGKGASSPVMTTEVCESNDQPRVISTLL